MAKVLKDALKELFDSMGVTTLLVESSLEIPVNGFILDFLKMCDEICCEEDIIEFWHIQHDVARAVYAVFHEVLHGSTCM